MFFWLALLYTLLPQASATSLYITCLSSLLCKLSLFPFSSILQSKSFIYSSPSSSSNQFFLRICWQSSFVVAYTLKDFSFIPYKCFLIVLLGDLYNMDVVGMEGEVLFALFHLVVIEHNLQIVPLH